MSPSTKASASVASAASDVPAGPVAPAGRPVGREEKPSPSLLQRAYQATRVLTLASLIAVVFLIAHRAPRPKVSTDPAATAHVDQKLKDLETAQEAGTPHELRLDEAELNSYLASNLELKANNQGAHAVQAPTGSPVRTQDPTPSDDGASAASPAAQSGQPPASSAPTGTPTVADPSYEDVQSSVKDVQMTTVDDRVQAYVVFDFHGEDLSLTLDGRLHVQDGYLRFEPVEGKLGSLPLPQSTLQSAVQRLFDSPENKERFRVPPDVNDIRIQNGQLVVAYK